MKKLLSKLIVSVLLFSMVLTPSLVNAQQKPEHDKMCGRKIGQLISDERKLWIDHVLWTRNFIISDIDGLEDKQKVLERLLKNQEDIGSSIKPYFGDEAGEKLTSLLKEHISIAGQVVDAVKGGNKTDIDKYSKLWYKNADAITDYLNRINPEWSISELKDLLYRHLQLLTEQVMARKNKDWAADIVSYDAGEEHILKMADTLSHGIIKKFPDKFRAIE